MSILTAQITKRNAIIIVSILALLAINVYYFFFENKNQLPYVFSRAEVYSPLDPPPYPFVDKLEINGAYAGKAFRPNTIVTPQNCLVLTGSPTDTQECTSPYGVKLMHTIPILPLTQHRYLLTKNSQIYYVNNINGLTRVATYDPTTRTAQEIFPPPFILLEEAWYSLSRFPGEILMFPIRITAIMFNVVDGM